MVTRTAETAEVESAALRTGYARAGITAVGAERLALTHLCPAERAAGGGRVSAVRADGKTRGYRRSARCAQIVALRRTTFLTEAGAGRYGGPAVAAFAGSRRGYSRPLALLIFLKMFLVA